MTRILAALLLAASISACAGMTVASKGKTYTCIPNDPNDRQLFGDGPAKGSSVTVTDSHGNP